MYDMNSGNEMNITFTKVNVFCIKYKLFKKKKNLGSTVVTLKMHFLYQNFQCFSDVCLLVGVETRPRKQQQQQQHRCCLWDPLLSCWSR